MSPQISSGPGYVDAPLPVNEDKRSSSSRDSKDKNRAWNVSDIGIFMPERWLAEGEGSDMRFDSRAGPALPFGAGPRGCFGTYAAYIL